LNRIKSSILSAAFMASCAVLMSSLPGSAIAALVFNLNNDSCTGGCGPAGTSFGTVMLSDVDSNTVHVDVDLTSASTLFIQTGAGYSLTWNGPTGETVNNMTSGFDYLGFGSYDTGGNFGTFNYAIDCHVGIGGACSHPGGGGGTTSVLAFDVTHLPALTLADFVATNPEGFYFTVDLIGPSGRTGVVGASTYVRVSPDCMPGLNGCASTVPEPASVLLVGIGLIGLCASRSANVRRLLAGQSAQA